MVSSLPYCRQCANTDACRQEQCNVRTPRATKTKTTKQKQHTTQKANNISCHPLPFRLVLGSNVVCIGVRTLHRCSHLASFHCSSLLGRLFISLAMAKKFFCGSCRHEVFEEGNCLSCHILLSRKLRSVSEGREPVSYSKDTQTPPDGNGDMHRFIRALLLRRPDAAIDKAVKENRWKDAYELEIKYHMEAAVSITSDGPGRFATPAEARPPP